jgi:hypothetical protein
MRSFLPILLLVIGGTVPRAEGEVLIRISLEIVTYVTAWHPEQRLYVSSASRDFVSHLAHQQKRFSWYPVLSLSPLSASSCKPNAVPKARNDNTDCQRAADSFVISSSVFCFCFFLFVTPGKFRPSEKAVFEMSESKSLRVGINKGVKCLRRVEISSGVARTRHVASRHRATWIVILNTRNQAARMQVNGFTKRRLKTFTYKHTNLA